MKATDCPAPLARQVLAGMNTVLRERALRAASNQTGWLHDPIEDDPGFHEAFVIAQAEAEKIAAAKGVLGHMGGCHILWEEQARILREQFGITWFSPQSMNPHVCYD